MGKLIKALVVLAISLSLIFFQALFAFKTYTWFGPETGLNLPDLSYFNMVAILLASSVFRMNLGINQKLDKIYNEVVEDKQDALLGTIGKALAWILGTGISYLYYIAIF